MEQTQEEELAYSIWISHADKIVSFQCEQGFEQLHFPSQEEKIAYAMKQCSSGYRIQ